MTLVMKLTHGIGNNTCSTRSVFNQLTDAVITKWNQYRQNQNELRRLHLSSPEVSHIPWRVWKTHGAMLNEITGRHKQTRYWVSW